MAEGTVYKFKQRTNDETDFNALNDYNIGATFDNVIYYDEDGSEDNGITLLSFFKQMQSLVKNGQFTIRGETSPSENTAIDTQLAFWIDESPEAI